MPPAVLGKLRNAFAPVGTACRQRLSTSSCGMTRCCCSSVSSSTAVTQPPSVIVGDLGEKLLHTAMQDLSSTCSAASPQRQCQRRQTPLLGHQSPCPDSRRHPCAERSSYAQIHQTSSNGIHKIRRPRVETIPIARHPFRRGMRKFIVRFHSPHIAAIIILEPHVQFCELVRFVLVTA